MANKERTGKIEISKCKPVFGCVVCNKSITKYENEYAIDFINACNQGTSINLCPECFKKLKEELNKVEL